MNRIYSYVDESGQDTKGKIYIIAVPTFGESRDGLRVVCEQIEEISGKQKFKWGKARPERRLEYLRLIFSDKRFLGCLRYRVVLGKTNYDVATVKAIAAAVLLDPPPDYTAMVYVDALSKTKRAEYMRDLRKLSVQVQDLRGIAKDENEALIRLADAIAGFARDVLTGILDTRREAQVLYQQALDTGYLVEV